MYSEVIFHDRVTSKTFFAVNLNPVNLFPSCYPHLKALPQKCIFQPGNILFYKRGGTECHRKRIFMTRLQRLRTPLIWMTSYSCEPCIIRSTSAFSSISSLIRASARASSVCLFPANISVALDSASIIIFWISWSMTQAISSL